MTKIASRLALILTLASPAAAQEAYIGGGLSYTKGTSDQVTGGSGSSDLSARAVTLVFGMRKDIGNAFWGVEANADLAFGAETGNSATGVPCSTSATGSYLCSQSSTIRLVGIFGASLGQGTELFASLGVGRLKGDFANSISTVESASINGMTYGVGFSRDFGNGLVGRGEVIRDRFNNSGQA